MTPSEELERRKGRLEGSIDALGWWMIGFTALVVIGLFIELKIPFLELLQTWDWTVFLDSIGALLVAAGVAGELSVEFRAHRQEKRLRVVNEAIEDHSAGRLQEAERKISELNVRSAELNVLAEQQAMARAEMEKRLAETMLLLEQEKIERLKLEKQLAWRRITPEQELRIKSKLVGCP